MTDLQFDLMCAALAVAAAFLLWIAFVELILKEREHNLCQRAADLLEQRQYAKAARMLESAINRWQAADQSLSPRVLEAMSLLAIIYFRFGHRASARRLVEPALEWVRRHWGPQDEKYCLLTHRVGVALCETGHVAQGLELLEDCRILYRSAQHPPHALLDTLLSLGLYLPRAAQGDRAVLMLGEALKEFSAEVNSKVALNCGLWQRVADADVSCGRMDEALDSAQHSLRMAAKADRRLRQQCFVALARVHAARQEWDQAVQALDDALRLAPLDRGVRRAEIVDYKADLLMRMRQKQEAEKLRIQAALLRGHLKAAPVGDWLHPYAA